MVPGGGRQGEGGAVVQKRTTSYLTTSEVASILRVSAKTVTRWARDGKLPHSRTLGGHRRFPTDEIRKLARDLMSPG